MPQANRAQVVAGFWRWLLRTYRQALPNWRSCSLAYIVSKSRILPDKYLPSTIAETTLGIEITSSNPGPQGVLWSLTTH